jgi:hypothetical protein
MKGQAYALISTLRASSNIEVSGISVFVEFRFSVFIEFRFSVIVHRLHGERQHPSAGRVIDVEYRRIRNEFLQKKFNLKV